MKYRWVGQFLRASLAFSVIMMVGFVSLGETSSELQPEAQRIIDSQSQLNVDIKVATRF